ncbi:MAG: hypothetical protein GYA36_15935 [Veillonellaceae bacterium]|nr:hypothetical protein [Veillonellaceae bacterium]
MPVVHDQDFQKFIVDSWKPEKPGEVIEGEVAFVDFLNCRDSAVPFIELIQDTGEPIRVLCGAFVLSQIVFSSQICSGSYLRIRYDGESKMIKKASNYAKLYSTQFYKPGDWSISPDGVFTGKPSRLTPMRKIQPAQLPSGVMIAPDVMNAAVSQTQTESQKPFAYEQDDSPFDPEVQSVDDPTEKAGKGKKSK